MFTSVNRSLDGKLDPVLRENAYFAGADGYTLFKDKTWLLEWLAGTTLVEGSESAIAATQRSGARYYQRPDRRNVEYDPTRTALGGWMDRVMLAKQKGKWRPNLQVQMLSPGFELNDVGFQTRTDTITTHALLQYVNTDLTRHTREISAWMGKYQNWNFDRDLTANGVSGNVYVQFKNYWQAWAWGGKAADHLDDRVTRGGPATIDRGHEYIGIGGGSDTRRDGFGGTSQSLYLWFTYRPTPGLKLALTPSYSRLHEMAQYVATIADASYAPTYGNRYVFSTLEQRTLDIGIRTDWTMNARLSLQLYLQPFIASGDYHGFKQLTRARDDEFTPTAYDRNPDFNLRSVRGSAVLRWEFRPGSSMYVVWNENRADVAPTGDFSLRRDVGALRNAPSQDVLLVKFSYWLPI
jgi:hypothetical protein